MASQKRLPKPLKLFLIIAGSLVACGLLGILILALVGNMPKENRRMAVSYSSDGKYLIEVRYVDFGGSFSGNCDAMTLWGCGGEYEFYYLKENNIFGRTREIDAPADAPCSSMTGACAIQVPQGGQAQYCLHEPYQASNGGTYCIAKETLPPFEVKDGQFTWYGTTYQVGF